MAPAFPEALAAHEMSAYLCVRGVGSASVTANFIFGRGCAILYVMDMKTEETRKAEMPQTPDKGSPTDKSQRIHGKLLPSCGIIKKIIQAKRKYVATGAAAAALVLIVIGLLISGVTTRNEDATITVNSGDGTIAVAEELSEQGAIHGKLLFRVVAKVMGRSGHWYAGSYTIPARSNFFAICEIMSHPANDITVTFREGLQVREMGTILEKNGICKKSEFISACKNHSFDYEFLKDVPAKKRIDGLEGYLFPDTYSFTKDEAVDDVICTMLDRFQEEVYTEETLAQVKESGYSFDEIIILASMVESEAMTTADRKTVAGVFLNRLSHPDQFPKLQSCVTVEYALGIKKDIISTEDTEYDSPYNTYLYAGLPYGPICCPSTESIEAVLNPTKSNYYYFQSDENGKLYFAKTWQEHAANQEKIQANWETNETRKVE